MHGRLDRFLAPVRRGQAFELAFDGTPAVKDPIEAAGVPHVEIGRVTFDGVDVALNARLRGGERVDAYPVERQSAGDPPRFVLDVHLGRLAGYLRLLGVDTAYSNVANDAALADAARHDRRVLLTRDVGLLKQMRATQAAFVYAVDPVAQLAEVIARFDLAHRLALFGRCARCNSPVVPADRSDVEMLVPPRARDAATGFSRCTGCGRVYWLGSHAPRLSQRLAAAGIEVPQPSTPPASPPASDA